MNDTDVVVIDESGAAADAADVVVLADAPDDLPSGAVRNADGSVIFTLARPVALKYRRASDDAVREESLVSLHLHRLTGADMRALANVKGDGALVTALARSARLNEAKMGAWFDRMDGADANACGQIVAGFLEPGRPTGR